MAEVTLQPGESKIVSFEVVTQAAKTYRVQVDGLEGTFTARAKILPFTYTFSCTKGVCPSAIAYGIAQMSATIKNNNSVPVTQNIKVMWARYSRTYAKWVGATGFVATRENSICDLRPCKINPFPLTLNPGATFNFSYAGYCSGVDPSDPTWTPCVPALMKNYNYYFWLEDESGGKSSEVMLTT